MRSGTLLNALLAIAFITLITLVGLVERDNFIELLFLFSAAIIFSLYLIKKSDHWKWWLFTGISARIAMLFCFPNLSDDIYRFFWDGVLSQHGISPYLHTPTLLLQSSAVIPQSLPEIFPLLNSPEYHSVYPPVLQWLFSATVWLSGEDFEYFTLILKILFLCFEVVSLCLLYVLSRKSNKTALLIYALNPLVILELTGNLHPETIVVTCLLAMWLFLKRMKLIPSALFLAIAVSTKLVPAIVIPFLLRRLPVRHVFIFLLTLTTAVIALMMPVLTEVALPGMGSSLSLYFQVFEFNASIYYLAREVGEIVKGYNLIAVLGPALAILCGLALAGIALREKKPGIQNLPDVIVVAFAIYLSCSTTVHPWYLTPMIVFCGFSRYRFPVYWSGAAILSYSAYQFDPVTEQYWLIALEYVIAGLALIHDLRRRKAQLAS